MSVNITKCLLARHTVPGLESLVDINEARSLLLSLEELLINEARTLLLSLEELFPVARPHTYHVLYLQMQQPFDEMGSTASYCC